MASESRMRIQSANPMHMLLLADNSGSLEGEPAAQVTKAIKNWILKMQMVSLGKKPYFKFSFVTFGDRSQVVAEAVKINDVDSEVVCIRGDGGGTNMIAALTDARLLVQRHVKPEDCPPFVFLFSDGVPLTDGRTPDVPHTLAAAAALKSIALPNGSPRLVTLGFGKVDDAFMARLASRPDFYKKVSSPQDLVSLLPDIGTPTQVGGKPASVESMEAKIAEQNI
jgi:uncharacterized protein YegL